MSIVETFGTKCVFCNQIVVSGDNPGAIHTRKPLQEALGSMHASDNELPMLINHDYMASPLEGMEFFPDEGLTQTSYQIPQHEFV